MNDDAAMAQQRNQAGRDQVRVAYGAVPVILEAFPESDPVRVKIRESARAMLVAQGYLTAEEMATLPVKEAITVVLKRLRTESSRRVATERAFSGSGTPGAD
jgi:hypothetical protein